VTAPRFVLDTELCTGCQACVLGCWMENRTTQTLPWRKVHTFNGHRHPDLPVFHLSLACHHCAHPACLEHCPAGAYTRDAATGAVTLRPEACMGCRYCTWACPHDAPHYASVKGTVEKCTFCRPRLERGLEPACVARCPVYALRVEPRAAGAQPSQAGFHGWALEPGIRFQGRPAPPALTAPPEASAVARALASLLFVPEPRITLRGEWTLVAFTTLLAAVTGRVAAGGPWGHPWALLGALAAAMALSALHLGRPGRAWRAVLNLRTSWLSREIALAAAFVVLCAAVFAGLLPAWSAAAAGFATLFAVDRVYQVAVKVPPYNLHSAHALLNGLYLAGILARWWPLAVTAGGLKLALYGFRKAYFARKGRSIRPALSLVRVATGFIGPLFLPVGWAAFGAILGDLIDRCEYYEELAFPAPPAALNEAILTSVYKY